MKASLQKLLRTRVEKMSVSIPEQKLMKIKEFYESEQMFIITKALIHFRGQGQCGELPRTDEYGPCESPNLRNLRRLLKNPGQPQSSGPHIWSGVARNTGWTISDSGR